MAEPLSIFYRIGPPINDLDIVRQQHQRESVGTADDAEIVICRTCYIFDEPWPCAVARLVAIVDEQIAADRLARLAVAAGPGPEERPDRVCPDCGFTATRIGEFHINAQEAAALSRPLPEHREEPSR